MPSSGSPGILFQVAGRRKRIWLDSYGGSIGDTEQPAVPVSVCRDASRKHRLQRGEVALCRQSYSGRNSHQLYHPRCHHLDSFLHRGKLHQKNQPQDNIPGTRSTIDLHLFLKQ